MMINHNFNKAPLDALFLDASTIGSCGYIACRFLNPNDSPADRELGFAGSGVFFVTGQ